MPRPLTPEVPVISTHLKITDIAFWDFHTISHSDYGFYEAQ
jgi:hypothetical protein